MFDNPTPYIPTWKRTTQGQSGGANSNPNARPGSRTHTRQSIQSSLSLRNYRPSVDAMTPQDWGLPEKFAKWRPYQFEAVLHGVESPKRFRVPIAPVGFGKSLVYMGQSTLTPETHGGRVAILTGTKGLQNQLMDDFSSMGLVDVRGRANYQCSMAGPDSGLTCEDGANCGCPHRRTDRCTARRAYNAAVRAPIITTNYTYWMLQHLHGEGLGAFDMLICDEGHNAPDEVAALMEVYITEREMGMLHARFLKSTATIDEWRAWAGGLISKANENVEYMRAQIEGRRSVSNTILRQLTQAINLQRKLESLSQSQGTWIVDQTKYGYAFNPLWSGPDTERLLFLGIEVVIITSATLNYKTLQLLDLDPDQYDLRSYPSCFDPRRVQIRWVPTCRVDARMGEYERFQLHARIGDLLRNFHDRNGLIQPPSYILGEQIYDAARVYQDRILFSRSGSETASSVARFKEMAGHPPLALMSPAITTGYDFPLLEAEYNIIPKIPFPPIQSKIMKARQEADPDYRDHLTSITLAQMCGRTARTPDCISQTLILDDHAEYFIPRALKRGLLAPWFKTFYDVCRNGVPSPLPKLLIK